MFKNFTIFFLLLGAVGTVFTSSKKECRETLYGSAVEALSSQSLINGDELTADSLDGSMLLISFWASYDPTSRINGYELVEISSRYHDAMFKGGDGLRTVCVSLDRFKAPMRRAIEVDGTGSLAHVCDYEGENSELARLFGVDAPVNLLVDDEGRVVARDFGVNTIVELLNFLKVE